MATLAEFSVPAEAFPLGRLFEAVPGATVELEAILPTRDEVLPYFWVRHLGSADLQALLSSHGAILDVTVVDALGDRTLAKATWDREIEGLLVALSDIDVTLLSGVGTANEWSFEIRADDQAALTAFQTYCRDHEVPITLRRIRQLADVAAEEFDLTSAQREALVLAYHEGYFDDPRGVTLEELGEQLGISRPSVSSRLRRGHRNLVGSTLVTEDRTPPGSNDL